jgi:hypothetical protein
MATIMAQKSEAGHTGYLSVVGGASVETTPTPPAWATYRLRVNGADAMQLWTASVSQFYGQTRLHMTATNSLLASFLRIYSQNATVNVTLRLDTAGRLVAARNTTTLGTGTTVLVADRDYLIEWRFTIHDTTGIVEVKLDGTTEITLTSQDTRNDAAASGDLCDRIEFVEGPASGVYFNDTIINSTTGSVNNSWVGGLAIEALMPTAAGDNTTLTPSAGANWQNVDERPPNDVTDYNSHATVNNYDLYNIPSTQWTSVGFVDLVLRAQKSDAGAKSIAHRVKADTDASGTADTEYTGSDLALSTSWAFYSKIYDQQPDSTSWTSAKVNALQPGAVVRT